MTWISDVMGQEKNTYSSRVGGDGNTPESRLSDNSSPTSLSTSDSLQEEGTGEQVLQFGVLPVSGSDVGQEDGFDDTSTTPHGGDTCVVEFPVLDLGGFTHEHESLGVGDDLGSVKGLLEVAVWVWLQY